MPVLSTARARVIAAALGFVSGYVDAVGFVALFGLFTAHVTGNFILIGATLARPMPGLIAKLAALPVFVLAVALTAFAIRAARGRTALALRGAWAAEIALLAAFAVVGLAAAPIIDADQPRVILCGLLGVAAMGIQNASSRLLLAELPPTTVMTGTVTQLAIDALAWTRASSAERAVLSTNAARFLPPLLGFAGGALIGASAFRWIGFVCLLLPMLVLAMLISDVAGTVAE